MRLSLGAVLATVAALTLWADAPRAQAPVKRPLTYDVVDSWRSIQGTRLSSDGQWLAYATTSQADDGELVVRNLKSGQQFTYGRGTGPVFTEDSAFVVFTIAQSKADEEKDRQAGRGSAGEEGSGPFTEDLNFRTDCCIVFIFKHLSVG